MKSVRLCLQILCLIAGIVFPAQAMTEWTEWAQFKASYIRDSGRVVDPSTSNKITTSEGQSYALFFALVANDKETFSQLIEWTENNLAEGDLTRHLPAWLWGHREDNSWGVIDSNSASDSDTWIAYSLLEAGRLWNIREYESKGYFLLKRIAQEETADIPELGLMLLPGRVGFVHGNQWKLNPSYQPLQLMKRFAQNSSSWQEIEKNSLQLLVDSSLKGFVPDWIRWQSPNGWLQIDGVAGMGGYDAIRSYLWAAMLPETDPNRKKLLAQWQPILDVVISLGYPPERININTGKTEGYGNAAIAYALLPMALDNEAARTILEKKIADSPLNDDAYYSYVLMLFSKGWVDKRFYFDSQGQLHPNWK
ncbi:MULTISPECIES: cellulose synthase complex periplasmic endoglucanase BcsZ [Providencia]|uniref:cellulose synthase complex periplasmic endoglucanase BcsZ n=1 Tax=Providencia TaxID=586 RepID=UPI001C5A72C9|nr:MULTISPECIES: cellulose synthase complex periplasmic endoglucanase BcsZ [Providencia]QXX81578.1 cellulase [Providencia sp. R33]